MDDEEPILEKAVGCVVPIRVRARFENRWQGVRGQQGRGLAGDFYADGSSFWCWWTDTQTLNLALRTVKRLRIGRLRKSAHTVGRRDATRISGLYGGASDFTNIHLAHYVNRMRVLRGRRALLPSEF